MPLLECVESHRSTRLRLVNGRIGPWLGVLCALIIGSTWSQLAAQTPARRRTVSLADSIARARQDSIRATRSAERRPIIRWRDRYVSPFSISLPKSPFLLRDPRAVSTDVQLNEPGRISVLERIGSQRETTRPTSATTTQPAATTGAIVSPVGVPTPVKPSPGLPYRPAESMTYEDYNRLQNQRVQKSLWREYSARNDGQSAVSGRGLIPKLELPPVFDRLFGGNLVDFKPNGFVLLDFGYLYQFIDNPIIPVLQRRNGNFIFNEQININFNGKIGERLGVTANYDTKSSFNFENVLKLNYRPPIPALPNASGLTNGLPGLPSANGLTSGLPNTGSLLQSNIPQFQAQDPSIIQGLEAGNISWPLSSQLIPGVQNLFGVKTQLRFGKLYATLVASQQRSKQDEITIKGGSLQKNYEIRVDTYDENRHFFLSQFFRNNYERSLNRLPQLMSGVTITRLEVYVTNRTNTTTTLRNIVGFADLAEPQPFNTANPNLQPINPNPASPADNTTGNGLFTKLKANTAIRQVDQVNALLDGSFGFAKGIDYELLRGAKRLTETEFKFQAELGYISLVTPLRNDEVLAVSYEYTYQGRKYQVGELTEDYQNRQDNEVLILKLLKSSTIRNNTQLPMWNLMMKNIYSLNTTQINKQNFQLRVVYKDDLTGIDNPNLQESAIKDIPLVQVFNMDQVNAQLDPQKDGNFDFVEGVTVDSRYGRVIFPVLEPFGSYLSRKLGTGADADVFKAKYVYNELYRTTLVDAQQVAGKNKFFLKGSYQSSTAGDVSLPYGVDEKSVQVTAGGVPLSPGIDFVVESQIGRVRFLNESLLNSGQEIKVRFERPDLFQNQIRRLIGTRLDYKLSPEVNLGMTAMNMRETPAGFLTRVAIGNEPVNNTILGFDATIRKDSRFLTKLLDGLPLIQTKELSSIAFQGEVAQLFPGVAPRVNNNAFIDDFEAARTLYDLTRQPTRWRLGSTPTTPERAFPQGTFAEPLAYAYNRARISVYTVDNTFSTATGIANNRVPQSNLTDNDLKNFYEQFFLSNELFKGRSQRLVNLPENILDVAYFPRERGMYNFNPNLAADGRLAGDPKKNFGAVMRAISSDADFDNANIENVEFWLMDPFRGIVDTTNAVIHDGFENKANRTGGKLIFNLGDISEDVIKDSRYGFENGLSVPNGLSPDSTAWGRVTRSQFVTQAFDNVARPQQDVGLDGLSNRDENRYFKTYIDQVSPRLNAQARERLLSDPANDDFIFYYGQRADSVRHIVSRYKQYMGMENNSPELQDRNQLVTPASTTLPDVEDLNTDNTINDNEAYYEYEVDLKPGQIAVGKGFVVDKVDVQTKAGVVTWYLFRIPVRDNPKKVGNINGFKSMRFARMYLTEFEEPVVLRFAQLQMTSNQYRKYTGDLSARGLQEVPEPYDAQFKVAAVNIEENSAPGQNKYIYRVPPGFQRDRDFTQINQVELNEQSMSLGVTNLRDGDSRAAFKNTNLDLLFRERLKMFIHMHNEANESGQVSAFIRLGTDFTDNYYEIEIPKLVNTPEGTQPDDVVWPAANDLDIAIDELINLKAEKNRQFTRSSAQPFSMVSLDGRYNLTVVGNPDLSAVQVVMIGVRNPKSPDEQAKSFTIWVDELRANGFDQTAGRAAVGVLNAKLADVATVTASGKITTFGFGGVQQRISERSRETTTEYGIQSQIAVDKLLPEKWGLRIPLYVNYDKRLIQPHFNPLDPDTPLETTLSTLNENERQKYRRLVEDNSIRRGFNLSNLRKVKTNPNAKNHFYDVENLAFTYAFNEATRTNILTEQYVQKQTRGGIAYVFSAQPKPFEPFKRFESLERPYLRWLRDFNLTLLPTQVSIRGEVDRSFIKTQLRNSELTTAGMVPQFEKYFWFNRYYDLQWNLTRNLIFTYNARTNAIIDEPAGDLNTQAKVDSVWANARRFGRTKNFEQNMRTTYRMPLDKLPLLDWIAADLTYNIGYQFQANSYGITDTLNVPFGNTIRNNREWGVQGRVDFIRLYNKIKSLRFANTPSVPRKNFTRNPGDIEDIQRSESRVLKSFVRTLLTIRGINFNYTIQESTILPGFLPTARFFGLSRENAPGLPFVLGSQDRNINRKASERGWLSHSTVQNQPFTQTRGKKFDARTTLEPFKDFRITVEARLTRQDSYQEIYRPDTIGGSFTSLSPYRNGQFSMSFLSFKTAFSKLNKDNSSPIFDRFAEYRKVILNRLMQINPETGKGGEYNLTSQDVLIPAFFAAYSGKDPSKVEINPFLRFPLPNWRVDYNGLSQLKPFRKLFSAFTLSHSYNSTYSVGNFTSSLDYAALYVNLAVMNYPLATRYNIDNQFVPVFVMSTITMTERFAPLLGITFRTQSKISGGLEYNQDRSVALNLSNAQVAELSNKDITFRFGFTKTNFKVPFKINGAYKRLKNDLTFNCNLTFRDTRTVQRKFDDSSTAPANLNGVGEQIITAGNVNFQLRPQVSYVVSRRLNVQVYFDRTFNDPLVSNSFRRATTAGGVQVRFNLAE